MQILLKPVPCFIFVIDIYDDNPSFLLQLLLLAYLHLLMSNSFKNTGFVNTFIYTYALYMIIIFCLM